MNILHIAAITNNLCDGICVAVPLHINAQANYTNIMFFNIFDEDINTINSEIVLKNFEVQKVKETTDLVVFHQIYRKEFLSIAKQLKKNNIPYIIVPHGSLTKITQKKNKIKKIVGNFLFFNKFINNARAIQCLSKKEMQTSIGDHKFIGTNGIAVPNCKKLSFNTQELKFVYIGRLDFCHKGLDLMIEAIASVKQFMREKNASLYIYGPHILAPVKAIQKLINKYQIEDLVVLKTQLLKKEKEEELLSSDIFIQTSRSEGMPMGILEALSYGLPCLVTKGTTLGEKIEQYNAGWVAETSAESVAEKIKQAIEEKQYYLEKSKNAVDLIKKDFSWDKIARDTIEEYKKYINLRK